ncbi:Alpha-methylacyl-CoA racemase [Vanrija pseudolonga]|uniref:Alpha-methylacyl-CoA racemase n=1 Tax=Vanrija pseudolonga TaxID=143232 RepID=A0AAF0Y0F7_9TREE|nr:Alpha-methylacyl-CoA racemase [Vanrija pseudolonga]
MSFPLQGLRVVEFSGIGPGPFASMVLADFGADVVRIDRGGSLRSDVTSRGKTSLIVDLKDPNGKAVLHKMLAKADVLIDPYRPGVLDKLGFGPAQLEKLNPRLIVARMTGFPRNNSTYSQMAGHDINYIAASGVLDMIRSKDAHGEPSTPVPPLNLLGDFAGGGIMLVLGILFAVIERQASGKGQVVDTDMVSGARYISSFPLLLAHPQSGAFMWSNPPGNNLLDGGAPFYGVYKTKDDKYMSVGCLEPEFFAEFARIINPFLRSPLSVETQQDPSSWAEMRGTLADAFATKTRDEWAKLFHETDACCVPVLTAADVSGNELGQPGAQASADVPLPPAPHPNLSRTPARSIPTYSEQTDFFIEKGSGLDKVLGQLGGQLSAEETAYLKKANGAKAKL